MKETDAKQGIVDEAPEAEIYATYGYVAYLKAVYPGEHIRNIHNKADTHIVERINADLRHYISGPAQRKHI